MSQTRFECTPGSKLEREGTLPGGDPLPSQGCLRIDSSYLATQRRPGARDVKEPRRGAPPRVIPIEAQLLEEPSFPLAPAEAPAREGSSVPRAAAPQSGCLARELTDRGSQK